MGFWKRMARDIAIGSAISVMAEKSKKEREYEEILKLVEKQTNFIQIWDLSENSLFGLNRIQRTPSGIICWCRYVEDDWYSVEIPKEVFWDKQKRPWLLWNHKVLYIDTKKCTPKGAIEEIYWSSDYRGAVKKYLKRNSKNRTNFVYTLEDYKEEQNERD